MGRHNKAECLELLAYLTPIGYKQLENTRNKNLLIQTPDNDIIMMRNNEHAYSWLADEINRKTDYLIVTVKTSDMKEWLRGFYWDRQTSGDSKIAIAYINELERRNWRTIPYGARRVKFEYVQGKGE